MFSFKIREQIPPPPKASIIPTFVAIDVNHTSLKFDVGFQKLINWYRTNINSV